MHPQAGFERLRELLAFAVWIFTRRCPWRTTRSLSFAHCIVHPLRAMPHVCLLVACACAPRFPSDNFFSDHHEASLKPTAFRNGQRKSSHAAPQGQEPRCSKVPAPSSLAVSSTTWQPHGVTNTRFWRDRARRDTAAEDFARRWPTHSSTHRQSAIHPSGAGIRATHRYIHTCRCTKRSRPGEQHTPARRTPCGYPERRGGGAAHGQARTDFSPDAVPTSPRVCARQP